MMQQKAPDDYVIATGNTYSVREFVTLAFKIVGIDIVWHGVGVDSKGIDARTGNVLVEVDPRYFRPTEVDLLCGDASKAKECLGWQSKTSLAELVRLMVEHDLSELESERGMPLFNAAALVKDSMIAQEQSS